MVWSHESASRRQSIRGPILRCETGGINGKTGLADRAAVVAQALALLLSCSIGGSSLIAQTQSEECEISRVESWFTGESLAEINSALASLRPKAVSESDKAFLMRVLPLMNADNCIEDKRQIGQLHARLESTLKQDC